MTNKIRTNLPLSFVVAAKKMSKIKHEQQPIHLEIIFVLRNVFIFFRRFQHESKLDANLNEFRFISTYKIIWYVGVDLVQQKW